MKNKLSATCGHCGHKNRVTLHRFHINYDAIARGLKPILTGICFACSQPVRLSREYSDILYSRRAQSLQAWKDRRERESANRANIPTVKTDRKTQKHTLVQVISLPQETCMMMQDGPVTHHGFMVLQKPTPDSILDFIESFSENERHDMLCAIVERLRARGLDPLAEIGTAQKTIIEQSAVNEPRADITTSTIPPAPHKRTLTVRVDGYIESLVVGNAWIIKENEPFGKWKGEIYKATRLEHGVNDFVIVKFDAPNHNIVTIKHTGKMRLVKY